MSSTAITPGAVLDRGDTGSIEAAQRLWGFGGLHGGLAVAMMVAAMQQRHAPEDARLRSATGRLHRSITTTVAVTTSLRRAGRITAVSAEAAVQGETVADGSAIFATDRGSAIQAMAPPVVTAPPPEECERFRPPLELVPISAFLDIRPVGPNLPFAGGAEPELTAWVRLTDDDRPVDAGRLILLIDALAPSYAATLTEVLTVPTLELTVTLGPGVPAATSPWLLVRSRTHAAYPDGWIDEYTDAWGRDGTHLASARQLRLVRRPASVPAA